MKPVTQLTGGSVTNCFIERDSVVCITDPKGIGDGVNFVAKKVD